METKARLHDISYGPNGKQRVTLELEFRRDMSGLKDTDLSLTLDVFKEKRSSNANRYFHKLSDLIAEKRTLGGDPISKTAQKNELVAEFGVRETIDGEPLTYKTNAPPEYMREVEEPHTSFWRMSEDGMYFYKLWGKTRNYDTRQMSNLIAGTVQRARDAGVPESQILSPNEQAELLSKWQNQSSKNQEKKQVS